MPTQGWTSGPNKRGTFDLLWSCLVTIALCSWSVLFLNLPSQENSGQVRHVLYKLRWMGFTILFSEVLTGLATEQWRTACQSVEDFSGLKQMWTSSATFLPLERVDSLNAMISVPWTMRHAFFAEMGGIQVSFPDFRPIPVNGYQLFQLVAKGYMRYPAVKEKEIWDKNKADGFARVLTVLQMAWFSSQCLARRAQGLNLTTLELTTLAFAFCTVQTLFFWLHKPLDVEEPIVVQCTARLDSIILREDQSGRLSRYNHTPLDSLNLRIHPMSIVPAFMFGVRAAFLQLKKPPRHLPIHTFGNASSTPPRGLTPSDMAYAIIYVTSYFGIHVWGWNFFFASDFERLLWRIASLTLLLLSIVFFVAFALGQLGVAAWCARCVRRDMTVRSTLEWTAIMPTWFAAFQHIPVLSSYLLARIYILVEGFFALRELPTSSYTTVDWARYIPHLA